MQPEWMPVTAGNVRRALERGDKLMLVANGSSIYSGFVAHSSDDHIEFIADGDGTRTVVKLNPRAKFIAMEPPTGFKFAGMAPAKLPLD